MKKREDKRQQVVTIFILSIIFSVYGILFSGNEKAGLWSNEAFAQTAEEYFQQGKTSLENQLLFAAHSSFQSALASDPNHQGANLFFALTRILMISNSTDFNTLLDRAGVNSSGRDIFNWTADFTRDPNGRILLPSNSPTGEELQNFLKNNILPEVDGALTNLTKVLSGFQTTYKWPVEDGSGSVNSPNTLTVPFTFWMMNEWAGYTIVVGGTEYTIQSNTYDTITVTTNWVVSPGTYNFRILETVEIDYGDVLVMKGSLYLAKGGIYVLSSYNLAIDIDAIISLYNAASLNFQNDVINTYTQLLTLLPSQQIPQAKSLMRDAINTFISAIDFIKAEIDPQDNDLFVIDDPVQEQRYRDLLADLNSALDGTTLIRENGFYLNLSQFFDNPKNLRNYLPTFRGQYFVQAYSFPDPTFGGISPFTTQNDLNRGLKRLDMLVGRPPNLRLYDDFSGPLIDQSKWNEAEETSGELARQISGGRLRSVLNTTGNSLSNNLSFKYPGKIKAIKAKVTPLFFDNPDGALTTTRLGGYFFTQFAPWIGPRDVWAEIGIGGSTQTPKAYWSVMRIDDPVGGWYTELASGSFPISITLGTTYDLYIYWDGSAFTFKFNDMEANYAPHILTNFPLNNQFKGLQTRIRQTGTGQSALVESTFDDVMVDVYPEVVDFDGDWKTDIFWRHATSGQTAVWLMYGPFYSIGSPGTVSDLNWQIKGIGDFNGDGKTDIFWQDSSTGWTSIWFMAGTTTSSQAAIGQVGLNWQIKGIGDFDGDGKADVLWQDSVSGWTAIWFMDGATVKSIGAPAQVGDSSWQIKAVGDFNGDGKADILWLHTTSGWTYIWFMDGATITSGGAPAQVGDASWQIKEVADFDGDGKTDILWLHTTSGWTYIWFMDGATITSGGAPAQVGDSSWHIKCVGDFNGDGKADVFWQHTTTGWTYIWFMDGGKISSTGVPAQVSDSNWQIMN
jgi:hypothetical protein